MITQHQAQSLNYMTEGVIFAIKASSPNLNHLRLWAKIRGAAVWGLLLWDETELNNVYVFISS